MRIGLLTTSFPRHALDPAGSFVLGFAGALAARGHTLEVLAPEPAEPIAAPRWPGIEVHFVPYMRPRRAARTFYGAGVLDNLRHDPLAWLGLAPFTLALYRAARERRAEWDAFVSHFALPCGFCASELSEHRPHLAVMHSADLHLLSRLPGRARLARRLAVRATALAFVSERARRTFVGWLGPDTEAARRCHVQPMGVALEAAPLDAALRVDTRARLGLDGFTLLTLARLVPVKGLAEAIAGLRDRADLTWLIAGDGPERERLLSLARRAKLRVRLLGNVVGANKRALLRAADAFVLPSRVLASGRSEGVPTALLEAMAHDLPIVACDVGGVSELVRDSETGLLVDPDTPRALERAIDRLRADPRLAAQLATRARALAADYSWETIGARLEAWLSARSSGAGAASDAIASAGLA